MKKQMVVGVLLGLCLTGAAEGFEQADFLAPRPEYSPAYFWMWKDRLDLSVLKAQLDEMKAKGLQSVCVHPFPKMFRPGYFSSEMEPDYLTPAYLDILKAVCDYAGKLGMNFWFYDEGGWPSGGACGQVAASDTKGEWLPMQIQPAANDVGYEIVRREAYGVARASLPSSIEKGATARFIELTHDKVFAKMAEAFGRQIKFTFTDEPEWPRDYWKPALGWTKDFAEVFQAKKGYDIRPYMGKILADYYTSGDDEITRRRIDYYEVVSDLFVERYLLPLRDWARQHGVMASGHLNGEDLPGLACRYGNGNLLKSLRAMDAPGVDVIWRQLFPNYGQGMEGSQMPFPRYARSAANMIGAKYTLSESFGIYGASITPQEMKWLVDYQMVRGINMFVFGYYAMSYDRQWMTLFEPQSGPVTPYWNFEAPYFRYIHRISSILGEGKPATEVAVFYDARGFFAGGLDTELAVRMHNAAADLLDRRHVDYDFVDDDPIIAAKIEKGALCIGPMRYRTFVMTSSKWMKPETRAKLAAFEKAGGRVVGVDGICTIAPACMIRGKFCENMRVTKRVKGDEALYFVVNESPWARNYTVSFDTKGAVTRFDAQEGRFYQVPQDAHGNIAYRSENFGSDIFLVNSKLPAEPPLPTFDYEATNEVFFVRLTNGWQITQQARYFAGSNALERVVEKSEPIALANLGDWREHFGKTFSGIATYTIDFDWNAPETEHLLDLGKVAWTCQVSFNGERLLDRFFAPFTWRVTPKKGRNRLEVTVANNLATALSDDETRERIHRDFYYPGIRNYEYRQMVFDKTKNEGGLFGPVLFRPLVSSR